MKNAALVIAISIVLCGLAAPANAQCGTSIGGWPFGPTYAADGNSQLAVYGSGRVLQVARWDDPSGPVVVGSLELPGLVNDVTIAGPWAYVAVADTGIVVIDISSPSRPELAASIETQDGVDTVNLDGDLLAAGDGIEGLILVDVSSPGQPVRLSTFPVDGNIHNVAIHGTLAFVAEQYFGFRIVDIADTSNPVSVASIEDLDHPRRVAVSGDGDTVYLTNYFDGINVIDVSDHLAPEVVDFVDNPSYTIDVLVDGGYLYAANRSYGMRIFDLADPQSPVEVRRVDPSGSNQSVAVHGNVAFLGNYTGGLRLVDISVPEEAEEFGFIEGMPESYDVAIQGGLAYVVGGNTQVLLDLAEPDGPEVLSIGEVYGYANAAVLDGRYVYIAADYRGVRVIDVVDPEDPQEVGFVEFDGATDVVKDGNLLYVVCYDDGIRVVDVTDPTAPLLIGVTDGFGARSLNFSGDVLYVTDHNVGVHMVDVSDPASPEVFGMVEIEDVSHPPAVDGDLLFVADATSGIAILDIADPRNPVELAWIYEPRYTFGMAVAADVLFAATIYGGAYSYDVSNPVSPLEIANTPLAFRREGAVGSEANLALVAEKEGGLEIFDLGLCSGDSPSADFTWRPGDPEEDRLVQLTDTSVGAVDSRQWNFGDGSGSQQRNPTHVWSEPGDYQVRLTVTGSQGSHQVTKTITVDPRSGGVPPITDPGDHTYVIAAASHAQGLEDTRWVTDVVLHNPGGSGGQAHIWFMQAGRDNTGAEGQPVSVPAGGSLLIEDAVLTLFSEDDASGGLLVGSDVPLVVTSRTYNDASTGTYGQFIPGRDLDDAVVEDEVVRLVQLTRSDDYRSNLGVANPTSAPVSVDVTLEDANGDLIVSRTLSVPPFGFLQRTDILGTDAEDAVAVVSSTTASASYFPYVSVVDNRTGDPMFIEPIAAARRVVVAAAAHVGGLEDTDWRTDLEVCNFNQESLEFDLMLLESEHDNSAPETEAISLPGMSCRRMPDVLETTFDFEGSAALDLRSHKGDGELTVSSRTFNSTDDGTYGQFLPGLAETEVLTVGDEGRIVQLAQSSSNDSGFRANVGFVNRSSSTTVVDVELKVATGTSLGSLSLTLQPYEHRQVNRIFRQVTGGEVANGFAVVSTDSPGGAFIAYASVVDNASGDPVYVPAMEVEE